MQEKILEEKIIQGKKNGLAVLLGIILLYILAAMGIAARWLILKYYAGGTITSLAASLIFAISLFIIIFGWILYDVAQGVDTTGDGIADDGSLRGSSEIVAARIRDEIQSKVQEAGLEIIEARITYLAYAPEIAAVMLQRQQASAIIDARKMIVDGAVGMVEMALERLNENHTVELDEERKAAMVSNLLVVLCGSHDAQPVVNSGSLY